MSSKPRKRPEDLRSQQWFGRQDRDGFAYRSWLKGCLLYTSDAADE